MARTVTYASMTHTDGINAILTVYRARLHGRKRLYIDLSEPGVQVLAQVATTARPLPYRAVAEQYATPDAPPFAW